MAGVNAFASDSRNILCGFEADDLTPIQAKQEASEVFDTAIALVTIFHMIDWIRWTLLLTSALVSVNLLSLFYILTVINLPFGTIACFIAIATRFSEEGNQCAAEGKQSTRAFYLGLQVVCLVVYILTFLAHIVYFKIRGVEWCHEQYTFKGEDED